MRPRFITRLMKSSLLLLLCCGGLNAAYGQYTTNFDGASDGTSATNYGFTDHNLNGITWSSDQAIIPNTPLAADWFNGTRSLRLRGYSVSHFTMTSNKADGLGTISFNYRRYGTDAQVTWRVEYSTNDGSTWSQIGSDFTAPGNNDIQVFSESVNVAGAIRVRIIHSSGGASSNRRLNIDDFQITDFLGVPTININDNGTQTAAGNVNQGTLNHILSQTAAAITDNDATLNTIEFTSSGTYISSDITNFKLRYSTDATLDGADATLSTITTIPSTGNTVSFSGLSQLISDGSTGYFFITADIAAAGTAGSTIAAGIPTFTFAAGTPTNNATAGGAQTIQSVNPALALSSPSPAVAAANFDQNTTNNLIYRFDLAMTVANTDLTEINITTTGNYAANAVSNLKAWYSTDATFDAGTDVLLATIASPAVAGAQSFSGFTQTLLSGNTSYIFITVDVSCDAADAATIGVDAITTADITTTASESGTANASGTHTLNEITPNNSSALSTSIASEEITISWTNPTACFDEVMIVAKAGSTIAGTPIGDGSAYTADLDFAGAGTSFDGGKVVYKGSTSPQTITGLTNNTQYFVRIFTRNGESWSAGVEVDATPENIVTINFDDDAKWSSAPTSYGNHTYTDGDVSFEGTDVLRNGTGAQDGFASALGTYSFRLHDEDGSKLVTTISSGGVNTFSFNIRRWDASPDPDYTLRYSTNGGDSYTTVATINNAALDGTSDWKTFNGTINSPFNNILIEIVRNGGERIMVDNFVYSPRAFEATTWNGSAWSNGTPDATKNAIVDGNFNIAAGFTANNLTVNIGAAVTVAAGETVTVNGDFTNNGTLTLEATDENTYAQLITNGTVSGNVTVQRNITGSTQGWRFISPAVSGTLANLGNSVQLSGAANVIRLNTNNPNAWVAQGGAGTDALVAGKGYVAYYGNDGVNGSNVATTLSLTGALNNSDVTVSGLSDGNGTSDFGWSVVGNPFAAGIDFSNTTEVALTNIEPAYYIWRPVEGNYATWHRTSGSSPAGVLNGTIAPMQGFLVKANDASPVLTINRAARTSASTGAQFRTTNLTDRLYIKVRHTGDNRSDETMLAAAPLATMNFESDFDALKAGTMSTTAYSISTRSADNRQLAINTVAAFDASVSVPVRITGNQPGPLSIEVNLDGVSSTAPIILEDLYLNRSHDLRAGAYNYAHVPAQTDRFVIHFAPLATSVAANGIDQVQVYTFEGNLYIRGMEQAEQLRITDMRGRVVYQAQQLQLNGEALLMQLAKGNYLVQVVGKQGVKTAKVQF